MTRQPDYFKTSDIDLAAAIFTATGERPKTCPGEKLVEFIFPNNSIIHNVVMSYASGALAQLVKPFAANRAWLYRLARDVCRTGGAQ